MGVLKYQLSKAMQNWVGMYKSNFSKLLFQAQVSVTIPQSTQMTSMFVPEDPRWF